MVALSWKHNRQGRIYQTLKKKDQYNIAFVGNRGFSRGSIHGHRYTRMCDLNIKLLFHPCRLILHSSFFGSKKFRKCSHDRSFPMQG